MSRHLPLDQVDQAQGLRRLFAHARVRFVPVVSNPHVSSAEREAVSAYFAASDAALAAKP